MTAPLPTEAGPVVTLITSFCFFLFGASDQTARLGAALAGTGLVVACWWLRPFVGRVGALLAALLLTWSPLALYTSRELTPEPFAAFCLLVLAICLLRLRAGAGRATLLVAAAAVTLAIFSHYLALPLAVLLIALVPLAGRLAAPPAPPAEPAAARRARRAGAEAAAPPADEATGAPRLAAPALARTDWLLAAAVAGGLTAIIALLASTGGVDLLGNLLSPLTGWVTAGAPLDRAPLYLPLLLLVYEPLLLVGALASAWTVGGARETAAQRLTGLLLVFWATAALLLAALVGDRDAAQALYPIVPLALLAGRVIGDLIANLPWERYLKQRGPILSGVSALAIVALLVFVSTLTGGGSGAVAGQLRHHAAARLHPLPDAGRRDDLPDPVDRLPAWRSGRAADRAGLPGALWRPLGRPTRLRPAGQRRRAGRPGAAGPRPAVGRRSARAPVARPDRPTPHRLGRHRRPRPGHRRRPRAGPALRLVPARRIRRAP